MPRLFALAVILLQSAASSGALITVGCVGDSITEGVGASCPPCPQPHPLQACGLAGCLHSWPGQLELLLGNGTSHSVLNWGHVAATMLSTTNCPSAHVDPTCGGRNCSNGKPCRSNGPPYWVTSEFARATNATAPLDAVIIMLGTNDAKLNNWKYLGNVTQYAADALRMVQTFLALPSRPQVFLSTPPPLYRATYSMNQTVVGVVIPRLLRAIAQRTGAHFIDMITPLGRWPELSDPQLFLPNATNGGCDDVKPGACKGDGCHPDDLGNRKIAEVVQRALAAAGVA